MAPHAAPGRRGRPGAVRRRGASAGPRRGARTPFLLLLALTALLFTVESRLHELVPSLAAVRPSLLALVGGTLALLVSGEPWRSWRERAFVNPILVTQVVYVLLAFVSVPFALWVGGSLTAAINLLPALCLMLVVAVTTARAGRRPVLLILIAALGLLSLAQILKGVAVEPGRYSIGMSFDPNDLGTLLAAMIPVAVALTTQRGSLLVRVVMGGCAALALVALARTGSRGGFVTLAIATVAAISMLRGPRKLVLFGVAIVTMGLTVALGPSAFRTRVTSLLSGEKDYNFTERGGRIQVWERGLGHMVRHPVTGVGIGNFTTAEGELLKEEGNSGAWMAPHNAYLQAGVELGVPGLITFLLLVGQLVRHAWRAARRREATPIDLALFGALIGYLVGSVFLSNAFAATLFLFSGLIAARVAAPRPDARAATDAPVPGRGRLRQRGGGAVSVPGPMVPRTGW